MDLSVRDEFIWNDAEKVFVHRPTVDFVFRTLEAVIGQRGEQIDIDVLQLLLVDQSPSEHFAHLIRTSREAAMEAFEEAERE